MDRGTGYEIAICFGIGLGFGIGIGSLSGYRGIGVIGFVAVLSAVFLGLSDQPDKPKHFGQPL